MRSSFALLMSLAAACGRPAAESTRRDTTGMTGAGLNQSRDELVKLEKEWADAFKTHDTTFFQRTLSRDFVATMGDNTSDRAAVIKDAGDTNVAFLSMGDEDQKVRVHAGGKVGVVTGRARFVTQTGKQKTNQLIRYTEVFVKDDGRWQAVAGHYTPLATAK